MTSPGVIRLWTTAPAFLLVLVLAPLSWADEFEDPWEDFNRRIHRFNMTADRFVMKPVTLGYRFVTPEFVQAGVSNVFNNVLELPSALNALLQGKPGVAAHDSGRFLINSTLGVVGLFDVARHVGLEDGDHEDFGQTLGVWGFDEGPYLVLPLLGPSTVRDTLAMPVDWVADPLYQIDHTLTRNSILALHYINRRSQLMELEKHLTGDHYTFIRDAYLQRREYLINDGDVEDEFGSGSSEYGDFDASEEGDPF